MIPFILVFFLIYGSGHLYLLAKVRTISAPDRRPTLWLSLWSLLMIPAPILVHFLERSGFEGVAPPTALIAYCWMGFLFYFIVLALSFDLLSSLKRLLCRLSGRRTPCRSSCRRVVWCTIILAITLVGYGFIEARSIRLTRVVLPTDKLPQGVQRLKIVQISDLHLGLLVGGERLQTVVEMIRKAEPDLLVATGDLVDGQGDNLTELARRIEEIPTTYGKFAVLGNHEFYAGPAYSQSFLARAGFVILRNRAQAVAGRLIIAGVDDRRQGTWPLKESAVERQLLAGLSDPKRFVLLLKHRPQVEPAALGHFDLQLSGHLHDGQMFPFGLLVRWLYPVPVSVLHPLEQGYLYVSRGAGTWGPPIRVLAPPEVTIIELVAKSPPGLQIRSSTH